MASNTEMKNPKTGDVKIVPDQLVKQYSERGWEKTSTSSKSSGSSSSSSKK